MTNHLYMLDTNILSDLIKNPTGKIRQKIASLDDERLCCTSIIVACELRYGSEKKNSEALSAKVDALLRTIHVLPLENRVDDDYARIRVHLERKGLPIGSNDLLIAAHARALDLTMVTANENEFQRVPRLRVENWLL